MFVHTGMCALNTSVQVQWAYVCKYSSIYYRAVRHLYLSSMHFENDDDDVCAARKSLCFFYFSMIIREPALVLLVLGGAGVHSSVVCLAFPLFSEENG